jgi:von Willebrand factor A domain-containing protein 8
MTGMPQQRLNHILRELTPTPPTVGTLKLGDITYEVLASLNPLRLAHLKELLDIQDPVNRDNLHFMLQKYMLAQDVFLVSQPGPYARSPDQNSGSGSGKISSTSTEFH